MNRGDELEPVILECLGQRDARHVVADRNDDVPHALVNQRRHLLEATADLEARHDSALLGRVRIEEGDGAHPSRELQDVLNETPHSPAP